MIARSHLHLMAVLAACLAGCTTQGDREAAAPIAPLLPARLQLDAPDDTAATLAQLRQFVADVDRDTARMERVTQLLPVGAGATGTVTAWRAGRAWQRVKVETEGDGFRTSDLYWLHDGFCVGARLESQRGMEARKSERVWFRDTTLYRWTDAAGRRLHRDARSTHFEISMMRERLDRVMAQLGR